MTYQGFILRLVIFSLITWFYFGISPSIVMPVIYGLIPIVCYEMLRPR